MDAQSLHQDALIWDAHRDVACEAPIHKRFLQGWMIECDMHLPLLRAGGIDAEIYAICVAPERDLPPTAQALKELDFIMTTLEQNRDTTRLATTTADVLAAKAEGKLAVLLSLEGAEPIMQELGLLRMFYRLGFRATGLVWNRRNAVADGGYEGRDGGGLSKFGRQVVQEMNRLGMMIDLAHSTPQGIRDVLALSELPVLYSHGCTAALSPHPRTLDDAQLEALAAKDSLFCVTTIPEALAANPREASIETVLDHVEHAVKIMGVEHVGLGADFDVYQSHLGLPAERWTTGLEEADRWPGLTAGLLARGYGEADVRKIMGENLLRLFRTVIG
jgi:membrane dipeptidase